MRSKMLCALAVTAGTLAAGPAASAAAPPANDAFETPVILGDASVTGHARRGDAAGRRARPWAPVGLVRLPAVRRAGRVAVELIARADLWPSRDGLHRHEPRGAAARRAGEAIGARVPFDAVAGQDYRVAVASNRCAVLDGSRFEPAVRPAPLPANDDVLGRRARPHPGQVQGNAADATAELGEAERHRHSVWYRIKPRRTGNLTIDLASAARAAAA